MARYYPHSTPGSKDYKPDPVKNLDENGWSEWLYKDEWTKEDQDRFDRLYGIAPYQQYFDYLLDKRIRERVFDLYGIDYANIRDPRNVVGTASTGAIVRWGVNFVSDNIRKLYR